MQIANQFGRLPRTSSTLTVPSVGPNGKKKKNHNQALFKPAGIYSKLLSISILAAGRKIIQHVILSHSMGKTFQGNYKAD